MFLIRTATSVRGTSSAVAALAHFEEMRQGGQSVSITNASGRSLTPGDLQQRIEVASSPGQY